MNTYPDLAEVLATLKVVRLPMRTRFRGIDYREVALFKGPYGWGEFSPFLEYGSEESARWLQAGLEAAFEEPLPILREYLDVNATLPAIDDGDEIKRVLALYPGAKCVKIKVEADGDRNRARISKVKELAPSISIRLDVNGAWSADQAVSFLEPISSEIEYVEQPCATIEELREVKRRIDIKVAADEVVRKSEDPLSIDLAGAADLVILKVSPLGGIRRSMRIAAHHGLPVVVSSALESAVGIAHGLRLAASIPDYQSPSGLATGALFTDDVAKLKIEAGRMRACKISDLDQSTLDRLAVEDDRYIWWQNRLRASFEVLEG